MNFRPLTVQERYFSQFNSSQANQNFGKYFLDGAPDTTATIAEINAAPIVAPTDSVVLKNKRMLIAGGIILAAVLCGVVYMNWKRQDEKK